jgi:hypothetical protein
MANTSRYVAIVLAILTSGCYVENRRLQGNSSMTLLMLDNLFYALAKYAQVCGGYPATLEALERPAAGSAANCEHLGTFVDATRAAGVYEEGDKLGMFEYAVGNLARLREKGIYREHRVRYVPRHPRPNGRYGGYSVSADPVERGVTGKASFWVSELGEVHRNWEGSAGPNDPVYREVRERPSPLP